MNKILQEIREIDIENNFITYFLQRIQRADYRGVHFAQHNRKDYDFLEIVLRNIYKHVHNDCFAVPRGDYIVKECS